MTEYLWLLLLVGGPAVLGAIIAFGMMSRRRLTPTEREMRNRATDRLYHDTNDS